MDGPVTTSIQVGKYKADIIDSILWARGHTYGRKFKLVCSGGGVAPDSINVSIMYTNNEPVSAYIPQVVYDDDPDWFIDVPLDRRDGNDSIVKTIIRTLLQHVHEKLPNIKHITFDDTSYLELEPEEGIPLYYFSIAFNGRTWYEAHFDARQADATKHEQYRNKVHELLYVETTKTNTPFVRFLEIAQPPIELIDELEIYYEHALTFGAFFESIPEMHRCRLVRDWIARFMSYYLRDGFTRTNWIIDLPVCANQTRMQSCYYYCPNGTIRYQYDNGTDIGVDITNCFFD